MNKKHEESQLTTDERIKAILYQYVKLYDRWSEDRQEFNKNLSNQDELLRIFIEQVKQFDKLEPRVRQQLATSISKASDLMAEKIGENVGNAATKAIDETVNKLSTVVSHATTVLNAYRSEVQYNHWKIIGVSFITTIITSLLIVFFLIPKSTLQLTDTQMQTYQNGQLLSKVWSKLSKKERSHLNDLANAPNATQNTDNILNNDSNTNDNQ